MNTKGFPSNKNTKVHVSTLNPNAVEFIPSFLRTVGSSSYSDAGKIGVAGSSGKAVFDRTDSSVSDHSDEVHEYWCRQLPDDITPDFRFVAGHDQSGSRDVTGVSLSRLSLHDGTNMSMFSSSDNGDLLVNKPNEASPCASANENRLFYVPAYGEERSSQSYLTLPSNPWDKQLLSGDDLLNKGREEHVFNGDSTSGLPNDFLVEQVELEGSMANQLDLLVKEFPGFAADSLADVYYANGCNLSSTIEMLTQLELQVDSGLNHNLSSKALSSPNLSSLDFPALPVADSQNSLTSYGGDDLLQVTGRPSTYKSSDKENLLLGKSFFSGASKGATDFASAVRKLPLPESGQLKYEKIGSMDLSSNLNRGSQLLSNSSGNGRFLNGDRLQNTGMARTATPWLETGDAVGNMYAEHREEARDHARIRNAYFEQARQAYLIGNKALAKELSIKGQLHNMHMKAAHGKAKESIFRQRNPSASYIQGYGKGQEQHMIDLHGLHVSEAIHVLKHELGIVKNTARTASQRLQVYICVGTGHHTKGSRTPARLPIAVQRYLLEEEGLEYSEPQPGLLRVVIY